MIKNVAALFFFVCLVCGATYAHPAQSIKASYDRIDQVLTVTITHPVSNSKDHYIKNVKITKDGKDILQQVFDLQFDNQKQIAKILLPKLADGTELKIKTECNHFGNKGETLNLTIPGYTDVTPAQAQVLIEEIADLEILDVSSNYKNEHLPGAKSFYLPTLSGRLNELDKNKTYLVYCYGDGPSKSGAKLLAENGFSKVYRLKGNYGAWVDAGYPVEK
jgi:rhodanese-related sulfurtransferase